MDTVTNQPFNTVAMTRFGRMLVNKNDIYIGQALLRYGEYSWGEIELMEQLISPDSTVVEVGANVGAHTIPLAQRLSNGWLYAFEPQRLVNQLLCANVALNQCARVTTYWAGAGRQNGALLIPDTSPFFSNNFGGISAEVDDGQMQNGTIRVPCMTIDSLGLNACSLIKMDVEGMELEVLRGAEQTIKEFRPALYLESDRPQIRRKLIGWLFDKNYQLWWHCPPIFSINNIFGETTDVFNVISINILAVPSELNLPVGMLQPIQSPDAEPVLGGAW